MELLNYLMHFIQVIVIQGMSVYYDFHSYLLYIIVYLETQEFHISNTESAVIVLFLSVKLSSLLKENPMGFAEI